MPIEFPLTPEMIREEMKRTISDIREETNWELTRNLSELTIKIGDAPEYGSKYGVNRNDKEIIYGSWLENLKPKYYKVNLVEFLIIRESIACFIDEDLLFDVDINLAQYILNISALAYMRKKHESRSFETRLINIRNRVLIIGENLKEEEKFFLAKLQSLSSIIISQQITYQHLFETFLHFLDETSLSEIDEGEILDYIYRYMSNIPEEIIAPIRLKKNTLQVVEKVIKLGFDATAKKISSILGRDHATIFREFNRIASRYKAYLKVHKNYHKLGLHFYYILIQLSKDKEDNFTRALNELNKDRYVGLIFEGENKSSRYIFSITLCPHFVSDSLGNKFENFLKNKVITSFEIKPIRNRIFMTSFIEDRFEPSIENYGKLLNEEITCTKLKTWDDNNFQKAPPMRFTEKEDNLLRAMSIYRSHSLVNPQSYRGFSAQMKKFAEDNNVNVNELDDYLGFMNVLRNQLLENNLIDFRLELTVTYLAIADQLIIKVNCNPDDEKVQTLMNKLSIFSSIFFIVYHDGIIIKIIGLNNGHEITNLIEDLLINNELEFETFTVNQKPLKYIPFNELYHYKGNKWALF
jgi:hypothetical protein